MALENKENSAKTDSKHELLAIKKKMDMCVISASVFAVNTAEHFINLYAASRIDSFYTAEHMESLDLFSKWIAVPFVVCGEELDIESSVLKDFKHLIAVRNSLIHAKPKYAYFDTPDQVEKANHKFEDKISDRRRVAKRSPKIIHNLFGELLKIDNDSSTKDLMDDLGVGINECLHT